MKIGFPYFLYEKFTRKKECRKKEKDAFSLLMGFLTIKKKNFT